MVADRYRGLEFSIYSGAFVFGIVMSALGAILPELFATIGFQKADAGGLFLAMNATMLASSVLFGPVCDRFGFRGPLLVSTLLIAGAFGALAGAGRYGSLMVSLGALGFGGGALNGGTNALLNDINPARRQAALNRLGVFFGCGALFMPFLIGLLLAAAGMRALLFSLAGLTFVPFALFLTSRFPAAKHVSGFSSREVGAVLGDPLLFLFGFLLFFQSGNEFTMGGWTSTHLAQSLGFSTRAASFALTGYWAAMMIGRLAVSKWGGRIASSSLVLGSALVALPSCLGLSFTGRPWMASVTVALAGLGFAAIFPTTLAQAGARFERYSGTAFSLIFGMALSGGMSAPWLAGRLTQQHGTAAAFWVTSFGSASILVLQLVIGRMLRMRLPVAEPV